MTTLITLNEKYDDRHDDDDDIDNDNDDKYL